MNTLLFTQFSFGRLVPTLLALVITLYLFYKNRTSLRSSRTFYFFLYLLSSTIFNGACFFAYSVYRPEGAYFWFIAALAPIGISFLIQFAYRFPGKAWPKEARALKWITVTAGLLVFIHFVHVSLQENIRISMTDYELPYNSPLVSVTCLIFFLWAIAVFLRQSVRLTAKIEEKSFIKSLLSPEGKDATAARNFAAIVSLEVANSVLVAVFMALHYLSVSQINMFMNVLLFITYVLYLFLFINSSGEPMLITEKVAGTVAAAVLFTLLIAGHYTLSVRDGAYDERNSALLVSVKNRIITEKYSALPEEILFLSDGKGEMIFSRIRGLSVDINAVKPYEDHKLFAAPPFRGADTPVKRSYLNTKYNHYFIYPITINNKEYIAGFSMNHYRTFMDRTAEDCIIGSILLFLLFLFISPLVLSGGLMKPLKELLELLSRREAGQGSIDDELKYITENVRQTIEVNRTLKKEIKGLRETLINSQKKKKEADTLSSAAEEKLRQVIEFIEENYRYDISREGLASHFGMGLSVLSKNFKLYTGMKIGDFINQLRIRDAEIQLERSDKKIIEIAYAVGFESLRTFNRVFSKIKGCTPTEFRENNFSN